MSTETTSALATRASAPRWRTDAAIAALASLAVLAVHAAGGFATLSIAGDDNDSLLRLVQVRDLLNGQGWFDLHQYRMGPEGGFVMHWSRLVDAPIAAIVAFASAVTGSTALGETAALIAWPALLFAAAMFFLIRAARSFAGEAVMFPAVVIGAVNLYVVGIFDPAALDHHNVQLVLTLAMLSFLLDASEHNKSGFLAGACAALMLAIGMETAPYVAVGGICVALWFLVDAPGARRTATGFGLAFATLCLGVFLGAVPSSGWPQAQCDAFSIVQLAAGAGAGLGFAALAASSAVRKTFTRRLIALGGLAVFLAALVMVFFPQCLGDPYAGLDPRLKTYWLNSISEAQPLWNILAADPTMALTYYAAPLVGLICLGGRLKRHGPSRNTLFVGAFLAAAFVVSVWQVRGSMFSIPLAVLPLAAWVAEWRERAGGSASLASRMTMLCAWLVSFSVSWSAAAAGLTTMLRPDAQAVAEAVSTPASQCQDAESYRELAALPSANVLAVSNLGASILRYSGHHVLSGPYHRNIEGNLLALSAFMEPADAAEQILRNHRIALVAICRGNDESAALADWAPQGLMANIRHGAVPDWLEPVEGTAGKPMELYRVRPRS